MTSFSSHRIMGFGAAFGLLLLTACNNPSDTASTTTELVDEETDALQGTPPADLEHDEATGMVEAAAATGGSFLALSDVHLLPADTPCPGQACETSPSFWTATQTQAQALVASEQPDFIIYLGDMPTHASQPASVRDGIFGDVLGGLANTAGSADIPVLYLPGNNDTLGVNAGFHGLNDYCPFTEDDRTVLNSASDPTRWPVLNGEADIIDNRHLADGYYAARIPIGASASPLRVLALNTNVFTSAYLLCSDTAATAGSAQLDWLATQLAGAATAGEPVLLATHVPPGLDGYRGHDQPTPSTMWDATMLYQGSDTSLHGRWMQDVMLEIIARHTGDITGIVAGHTHLNGIRRLHACDTADTVTELLLSVPGISADHGNNPALKLIRLDATLEPVDVTTWVANRGTDSPDWTSPTQYDFRTNYPNTTASGSSLLAQVDSLDEDDRVQAMLRYLYARETVGPPSGLTDPGFFRQAMDVTCGQ